ncbi:ASST-domain-containing protein [Aspergillus ambiguus]|uniref:arylsulfotransferase family protein n=1 Tax=Aspergillus ambiguus TaxID=176160 RepID=UPI003CCD8F50
MRFLPAASAFFGLCAAEYNTWPHQTFKSSSLEPPNLKITKSGPTSPGYLFFDQSWSAHQYGVFIMSDENELVWQSPRGDLHDFRVQTLDGKPVLTYWNGLAVPEPFGWGYGLIQILDQNYESLYNVTVTDDNYQSLGYINSTSFYSWLDMHEGTITSEGTMLATGYNVTRADLSAVGGPKNGWVADSLFYEIDIKTNEILYRWSALDHVDEITLESVQQFYPVSDWGRNSSAPYGYFHINSVEKFADGAYLISSRYFSSLFRIAQDGSVDWTLQGKDGGDFKLAHGLHFTYQHDARIHHEGDGHLLISIFDNDNSDVHNGTHHTEGIYMDVNTYTREVRPLLLLDDPKDEIYATSQGNVQRLPNGHSIMGYGSNPKIKEYSANGTCVMTAQFGPNEVVASYRGYRYPWVGTPNTAPDAFACVDRIHNQTNIYMSWNGATEHNVWRVSGGVTRDALRPVADARRTGFETVAIAKGALAFVQAEAQGMGIKPGVSQVVPVRTHC